jgi:hypothetical protein
MCLQTFTLFPCQLCFTVTATMLSISLFIREQNDPPKTQLSKIVLSSSDQTFDLFTKVLHPKHFHHFATKVSMVDFIFNLLDWRRVLHVSKPKLVS